MIFEDQFLAFQKFLSNDSGVWFVLQCSSLLDEACREEFVEEVSEEYEEIREEHYDSLKVRGQNWLCRGVFEAKNVSKCS